MNQFQNVSQVVDDGFKFLETMGYSLSNKEIVDSKVLGPGLKWIYSAKEIDREITLYYQSSSKHGPEFFSVFIGSCDGKNYILEDLFKMRRKPDLNRIFYNFSECVSSNEFCRDFLNNFKHLVEKEIFSIVSGSEWVDVQMDWSPYR